MSSLVIKNLPALLHAQLKARASRNHRSLTKEAIALLEASVNMQDHAPAPQSDPIDDLLAAGKAMAEQGVDFKAWAATSRDVWR